MKKEITESYTDPEYEVHMKDYKFKKFEPEDREEWIEYAVKQWFAGKTLEMVRVYYCGNEVASEHVLKFNTK